MGLVFRKKKPAFVGLPFDSGSYYAGGLAGKRDEVKARFARLLGQGGVRNLKVDQWSITMAKWFAEQREYYLIKYGGVQVYVFITDFGRDLFASWISFFNLGCLQRLMRFGIAAPTHLDVDDLEMLGRCMDLYIQHVLDEALREQGVAAAQVKKVVKEVRRKRFVRA